MMLRAIFFDIDDTLYSSTDFAWLAREKAVEAMRAHGLRGESERILRELREVVEEFSSNDDRHFDRLLDRLPRATVAGLNRALLVTAGVIAYHETKWEKLRIAPAAERLLADLAKTDLKLGIISAGLTKKQMEKILRLRLLRFVDPALILITDQQGIAKTNLKLYTRAARLARVKPADCMMVGDHPIRDIQSAKRAGLLATWHTGSGKYKHLRPDPPADHVIHKIGELRSVLADTYGLELGS